MMNSMGLPLSGSMLRTSVSKQFINAGLLRHKSFLWLKPLTLSPFSKQSKPTDPQAPELIIDESDQQQNTIHGPILEDFKHYLGTNMSENLKREMLTSKLAQFVEEVPSFSVDPTILQTLNKVVIRLYELNTKSLKKTFELVDKVKIFEKSTLAYTQLKYTTNRNLQVPPFVGLLSKEILQERNEILPHLALHFVVLGSEIARTSFENSIYLFLKNKTLKISPEATEWFIKYLSERNKMNISAYEKIYSAIIQTERPQMITDLFCQSLISHVESLFTEVPPVHNYKYPEQNIDRIAFLISKVANDSPNLSILVSTKLSLAKLLWELKSVIVESNISFSTLFESILSKDNLQLSYQEIRDVVFAQALEDELLIETLISILLSTPELEELNNMLCEFVILDDIKFSPELRFKAFCSQVDGSEAEAASKIVENLKGIEQNEVDFNKIYVNVVEIASLRGFNPTGVFYQVVNDYFNSITTLEPQVYTFKHRLDTAIEKGNFDQALAVFNESVDHIRWPSNFDPAVRKSLNELIILASNNFDNIKAFSSFFKQVKKQMVDCHCDAAAINAVAQMMLKEDHFVDIFELLRRELPKMKKDAQQKISVEGPEGERYLKLFLTVHNYLLSFTKGDDRDMEDIWVIYGELHRYFKVPSEYYLPAMKYFCLRDRLNGALIILRQMSRLNELHVEEHRIGPPLREIYMYLLNEFGDQLYEEGVEEVHERLKMDINMPKQDLQLLNCILNAYSNLQNVEEVKNLFLSMAAVPKSIGAIDQESIKIMIKTLTYSDIYYVKQFWNNLSQYELPINYDIYKQYLIAHVYSGQQRQAIELVGEMDNYDLQFKDDTLIAMYNYSFHPEDQDLIEEWASKSYPQLWEAAKKSGLLTPAEVREEPKLLVDQKM